MGRERIRTLLVGTPRVKLLAFSQGFDLEVVDVHLTLETIDASCSWRSHSKPSLGDFLPRCASGSRVL